MKTQAEILADLAGILRNFEDHEYSGPIDADTLFFGELGFVSIDAVILGEKLEAFYGQPIPFNQFLLKARDRGADDIRVGELAEFLSRNLEAV